MKSKIIQNFLQVSGAYLGLDVNAVAHNLSMQFKAESADEDGLHLYLGAKHNALTRYAQNAFGMQTCKAIF